MLLNCHLSGSSSRLLGRVGSHNVKVIVEALTSLLLDISFLGYLLAHCYVLLYGFDLENLMQGQGA